MFHTSELVTMQPVERTTPARKQRIERVVTYSFAAPWQLEHTGLAKGT